MNFNPFIAKMMPAMTKLYPVCDLQKLIYMLHKKCVAIAAIKYDKETVCNIMNVLHEENNTVFNGIKEIERYLFDLTHVSMVMALSISSFSSENFYFKFYDSYRTRKSNLIFTKNQVSIQSDPKENEKGMSSSYAIRYSNFAEDFKGWWNKPFDL
jgi:hypothetical protein